MNAHEKYMKRCLELAKKGSGKVAPNPMVGCVIVHKDKIIGEGFHEQYGSAHAEVNAIDSVKKKDIPFFRDSTLYVTLEPCSHFGKTPPCADLIIRKKIKYIVIGTIDPNPFVSGRGLQKLVSSGCDVKVGVLDEACRELNKRFFTFFEKKRPYITLKWAQTKDKYMGVADCRLQITGSEAAKLVHQWRSEEQAIMVGTNTALTDNPELTVRKIKGRNPIRVVIDKDLKIPLTFHLLDGSVQTIVFTEKKKVSKQNLEFVKVDFKKNILKQILNELYERKIHSLIVEGGAKLLNSFLEKGLWDEARVFTAKKKLVEIIGGKVDGVEAPKMKVKRISRKTTGNDVLEFYRN